MTEFTRFTCGSFPFSFSFSFGITVGGVGGRYCALFCLHAYRDSPFEGCARAVVRDRRSAATATHPRGSTFLHIIDLSECLGFDELFWSYSPSLSRLARRYNVYNVA